MKKGGRESHPGESVRSTSARVPSTSLYPPLGKLWRVLFAFVRRRPSQRRRFFWKRMGGLFVLHWPFPAACPPSALSRGHACILSSHLPILAPSACVAGNGLNELLSSLRTERRIDPRTQQRIRSIATMRNKLVHSVDANNLTMSNTFGTAARK